MTVICNEKPRYENTVLGAGKEIDLLKQKTNLNIVKPQGLPLKKSVRWVQGWDLALKGYTAKGLYKGCEHRTLTQTLDNHLERLLYLAKVMGKTLPTAPLYSFAVIHSNKLSYLLIHLLCFPMHLSP